MKTLALLATCLLASTPAWADTSVTASEAKCKASAEADRELVLAFYRRALVDRQPREAFERYMAPSFVEHKPDIPMGTREETVAFLSGIINDVPEARWEIVRAAAQDGIVFVHARFTPAPGAPEYALADVFRVRDCRIVEHWDVVGPPPKDAPNPNSRF